MLRKGLQPQVVQKHPIPRQNEIETLILQLTRVEHSAAAKPFPQDADLAAGNRYDHVRVEHHCHKCRNHQVDHYTREMALKEPPPPRWCPCRGHRPIYWPQIHFHDLFLHCLLRGEQGRLHMQSASSKVTSSIQRCYLETESELSCGSPDFDLITEVSDAVCEPGCGFGRVAAGEVLGAEVLVVSAVTQHVVDNRQDRCGHRDGRLLGTAACFETKELSLQIAILLARRAPGGLQQYRLEPRFALVDPRRAVLAGALVKARNESRP